MAVRPRRALICVLLVVTVVPTPTGANPPPKLGTTQIARYIIGGGTLIVTPKCDLPEPTTGGACFSGFSGVSEVSIVVRDDTFGYDSIHGYYEFLDAEQQLLADGTLCGAVVEQVPSGTSTLVVHLGGPANLGCFGRSTGVLNVPPQPTEGIILVAYGTPSNDEVDAASVVSKLPFTETRDVHLATVDSNEPNCSGYLLGDRSIWYALSLAAPLDLTITVRTTAQHTLGIFRVDAGVEPEPLACGERRSTFDGFTVYFIDYTMDSQGSTSVAHLAAKRGETYLFQVLGNFECDYYWQCPPYENCTPYCYNDEGWAKSQVSVISIDPAQAPANDDMANATILTGAYSASGGQEEKLLPRSLPFADDTSNVGASLEPQEPQPSCGSVESTLWYQITAYESRRMTVQTSPALTDTVLAVYRSQAAASNPGLAEAGCNDNRGAMAASGLVFSLAPGETYFIQAGTRPGHRGDLMIRFAWQPTGDDLQSAVDIADLPRESDVSLAGATLEPAEPLPSCRSVSGTVWFHFVPKWNLQFRAESRGVVAVYRVDGPGFDELVELGCSDGAGLGVPLSAGTTYVVQLGTASDTLESFWSTFRGTPSNDVFVSAEVVSELRFSDSVDARLATRESQEPVGCGDPGAGTIWYRYDSETDAVLAADSEYATVAISIYRAGSTSLTDLELVGCGEHRALFDVAAGESYFIQVATNWAANFALDRTPENDAFGSSQHIVSLPYEESRGLGGASLEPGEPRPSCWSGGILYSVWYKLDPQLPESFRIDIKLDGSLAHHVIAAYAGPDAATFDDLREFGCSTSSSWIVDPASSNGAIYIQVASRAAPCSWCGWDLLSFRARRYPVDF